MRWNFPDEYGTLHGFGVFSQIEIISRNIVADMIASLTEGCDFKSDIQVGKSRYSDPSWPSLRDPDRLGQAEFSSDLQTVESLLQAILTSTGLSLRSVSDRHSKACTASISVSRMNRRTSVYVVQYVFGMGTDEKCFDNRLCSMAMMDDRSLHLRQSIDMFLSSDRMCFWFIR
jgi:hypothetical protein